MGNVLKKLVRKEFGEENYARYCRYIFYETGKPRAQNPMIYEDMYHFLEGKDPQALLSMKERLDRVLLQAFVICKGYSAKVAASLGAMFLLYLLELPPLVFMIFFGIVLIGITVKTFEYVGNKYCYVDARIVLIYKNVLEKLCLGGKTGGGR